MTPLDAPSDLAPAMNPSEGAFTQRSVERALVSARRRAAARAQHIIDVAAKIVLEEGNAEFTLTYLLTRGRVSQSTFYRFFDAKEELLLALCSSTVHRAVQDVRTQLEVHSDPVVRLKIAAGCLSDLHRPGRIAESSIIGGLTSQLMLWQPSKLQAAYAPMTDLFVQLMEDLATAGRLNPKLTPRSAAILTMQGLIANARLIGTEAAGKDFPSGVDAPFWIFCVQGFTPGD